MRDFTNKWFENKSGLSGTNSFSDLNFTRETTTEIQHSPKLGESFQQSGTNS